MVEITIHGAGITGLFCAWEMARRGVTVQVIDPGGVAAGASGGIVGALAPHVPENWNPKKAQQFAALDAAQAQWAEIAQIGGADPGYARTGRVQPLDDDNAVALANQRAETAKALWQGRYDWRVEEADAFGLGVRSATGLVVFDTLTARLHPRKACDALARALQAKGAEILPERPANRPKGVEIWATGAADLAEISVQLGKPIGQAIKGQAALLKADLRDSPQVFVDGLHIVPHGDGTVAIGSTTERAFSSADGTDGLLDPLIETARATLPVLVSAPVVRKWAGLRPRARSRAPIVGEHPTRPGAFIANGGFKIGLAMAPVMAAFLADLILDGTDTIPPDFRPEASL